MTDEPYEHLHARLIAQLEADSPNGGVLTSAAVHRVCTECLYDEGVNPPQGAPITEGITADFAFQPDRVEAHRAEIGRMLAELSDEFWADHGRGWTFLNACYDRHGNQWTGMHRAVETLLVLGLATGQAGYLLPRDWWDAWPGKLPYFWVKPDVDPWGPR